MSEQARHQRRDASAARPAREHVAGVPAKLAARVRLFDTGHDRERRPRRAVDRDGGGADPAAARLPRDPEVADDIPRPDPDNDQG